MLGVALACAAILAPLSAQATITLPTESAEHLIEEKSGGTTLDEHQFEALYTSGLNGIAATIYGAAASSASGDGHNHRRRLLASGTNTKNIHRALLSGDHAHQIDTEVTADSMFVRYQEDDAMDASGFTAAIMDVWQCLVEPSCTVMRVDDSVRPSQGLVLGLGAALFGESIIGGLVPVLVRSFARRGKFILSLLSTFSAGIFLTVGLTHILPEAIELQKYVSLPRTYPLATTMAMIGFLLIFFIERILFSTHDLQCPPEEHGHGHGHGHGKGDQMDDKAYDNTQNWHGNHQVSPARIDPENGVTVEPPKAHSFWGALVETRSSIVLLLALMSHCIFAGMALGLSPTTASMWNLFIAISCHKFFESVSLGARFVVEGMSVMACVMWLLPFSLSIFIGVVIGTVVPANNYIASTIFQGLSAGTFIYVGAFEVLSHEFGSHHHGSGGMLGGKKPAEHDECIHDARDCPVEGEDGKAVVMSSDASVPPHSHSPDALTRMARFQLYGAFVLGCTAMMLINLIQH